MLAITAATTAVFWIAEGFEAALAVACPARLHGGGALRPPALEHARGDERHRRRARALALHAGRGVRRHRDVLRAAGLVARDGGPGRSERDAGALCAIFGADVHRRRAVLARRS